MFPLQDEIPSHPTTPQAYPEIPDWSAFHATAPKVTVDPLLGTYAKSKYPKSRTPTDDPTAVESSSKRGRKTLPKAPLDPGQDYSVWGTHDGPNLPEELASLVRASASVVGMTVEDVLEELKALEKLLYRTLHPDRHEGRSSRRRKVRRAGGSAKEGATTAGESSGDDSATDSAAEEAAESGRAPLFSVTPDD